MDSDDNTALESGPTHARKGERRGHCDAVFCEGHSAVGILEVEGGDPVKAARKIGHFFSAGDHFEPLWFAVLLLYKIGPTGRRGKRKFEFPFVLDSPVSAEVRRVSREHPEKSIIVIGLHKEFLWKQPGIRGKNQYYSSSVIEVSSFPFRGGELREQPRPRKFKSIDWRESGT